MAEKSHPVHPDVDKLADYFASKLSEASKDSLEQHFAECGDCCRIARRVYSSSLLLERWFSGKQPETDLNAVLARNLDALASANVVWRERLRKWTENWAGRAEGAVRMVMGSSSNAASIATDGLTELLRPGARWQFALEPIGAPIRGQTPPQSISVAATIGSPRARVAVSAEARELEVRIDELSEGLDVPLVLLIPLSQDLEPQVKELSRSAGVSYCIARFEDLQPGQYLVALEPMR
jgi:hypothetical protein